MLWIMSMKLSQSTTIAGIEATYIDWESAPPFPTSSDPRHMPSSASLVVTSRRKQGKPLFLCYLHQRIAVAIQQGNAAVVLGTSPSGDTDSIFIR